MTSCHLVTDSDLSLAGHIDFRNLENTIGEFITDLDAVNFPLGLCCLLKHITELTL